MRPLLFLQSTCNATLLIPSICVFIQHLMFSLVTLSVFLNSGRDYSSQVLHAPHRAHGTLRMYLPSCLPHPSPRCPSLRLFWLLSRPRKHAHGVNTHSLTHAHTATPHAGQYWNVSKCFLGVCERGSSYPCFWQSLAISSPWVFVRKEMGVKRVASYGLSQWGPMEADEDISHCCHNKHSTFNNTVLPTDIL